MILLYIKDQGQTMHARVPAGRTMLKVCLSALTLSNCFSGVARLRHTGACALATRGRAPPV